MLFRSPRKHEWKVAFCSSRISAVSVWDGSQHHDVSPSARSLQVTRSSSLLSRSNCYLKRGDPDPISCSFCSTNIHCPSSSVQSLSRVQLFETPRPAARQAPLSITSSQSLLKLMSIESVMPSDHLILCHPLLLLLSIFFSIRVISKESVLCIRRPKYWSSSFSISPFNEHSGLISFRMDWLDLLAVQGTLESSPTPQFKGVQFSLSASSMHSTH